MERTEILAAMGELKLYCMKAAFGEIITTAVKRQHGPQRIVGDLLIAEITAKHARSIKYRPPSPSCRSPSRCASRGLPLCCYRGKHAPLRGLFCTPIRVQSGPNDIHWAFILAAAACNLVRLPKLMVGVVITGPPKPTLPRELRSEITCPHCGHRKMEEMPTDAGQFLYERQACGTLLRPKAGHCCVFCSYGAVACQPIQLSVKALVIVPAAAGRCEVTSSTAC
jgi:hypothetical protein